MILKGSKRYIALAAALVTLISALTSCSSSSGSSSSQTTNTSSSSAADTATESTGNADNTAVEYENKLFDTSYVHTIDISISDSDWSDLKENSTEKNKYKTNITIDGETVNSVSFSTKGNTSLSSIASDEDSDRYSFKVNFGKYVDDQTYYGLKKLNLNNIYADSTYMKDYLSYEIFRQAGVDSPLTSYVWLTVNGEVQGLYLAVEDISSSYLERTQNGEGELYKPENEMLGNMGKMKMPDGDFDFSENMPDGFEMPDGMTMPEGMTMPDRAGNSDSDKKNSRRGGGNHPPMNGSGNFEMPEGMSMPDGFDFPEGMTMPEGMDMPDMSGFPGGMGFGGSDGADLAYSDDNIDSYSDIFNNCITDPDDEAKKRVINALKGLSEGKDLESYLDTDEVIRYFAAHNFVLNYDSYTGSMLHNYYLYEKDGKLSMLPWDYNLAFGGFGGGGGFDGKNPFGGGEKPDEESEMKMPDSDATSLVNTGIDTPISGSKDSSRPMWDWIANNEEYLEKYHQVYDELLENYFESGEFGKQIDAVYEMILPYVEKDTTAFYSVDEFKKGYSTLKQFCLLRAESIRAQLSGELSAETDKQEADKQIDASSIKIDDMGKQGGGPDGGKGFGGFGGFGKKSKESSSESTEQE